MIYEWGSWEDFGALLRTLRTIADKHQVDVSNVATRWVLQRPETGCVIVGTRLGVSNNAAANLKAFTFELDPEEIAVIEDAALGAGREKALALYKAVGDCGQEYR
jgi:aryl-alcohol dehydrogenase-like predicted oxidoreductase